MNKINKKLFIFGLLIIVILLSTFYSEGMTYKMKNAFVNTDTGVGRLTSIDTDGNFSSNISQVEISKINMETSQPIKNTQPVLTNTQPVLTNTQPVLTNTQPVLTNMQQVLNSNTINQNVIKEIIDYKLNNKLPNINNDVTLPMPTLQIPTTTAGLKNIYDNKKPPIDSYISNDYFVLEDGNFCPNGKHSSFNKECYNCKSGYKNLGYIYSNTCVKCDEGYFPMKLQNEITGKNELTCISKCPNGYLTHNFYCLSPTYAQQVMTPEMYHNTINEQESEKRYMNYMLSLP